MQELSVSPSLLSYEEGAMLIDESIIEESLDLGHSVIYKLRHPRRGRVFLVSSAVGQSGMIPV